ncbi:hypothetical protein ABEF95_005760 [Exophiala dermatitidis]
MASRRGASAPRRSTRNQERQTTLQFSPLPSSSPAKSGYSPAVQNRLASIRYQGSKHASKKPQDGEDDNVGHTPALPTPEPSSQVGESHHVPVRSPTRTVSPSSPHARRASSYENQDVEEDDYEDDLVPSARKRRRFSPTGTPVRQSGSPQPRRSSRLHSTSATQPEYSSKADRGILAEPQSSPLKRRSGRRRAHRLPSRTAQSPDSEYRSSSPAVSNHVSSPVRQSTSRLSDLGSPEGSDDEDIVMASRPTARRRQSKPAASRDPFVVNDDDVESISDNDRPMRAHKSRGSKADDFIVDDDEVEYISSDDGTSHVAKNNGRSRNMFASHKTPGKRRRSRKEQEELDEDLKDLQDSNSQPEITEAKTRTRGGPVTTNRDKTRAHLELLRRRRAGEKAPRVEDSDEEEQPEEEGVDIDFIGRPDRDISPEGSVHSSVDTGDQEELHQAPQDDGDEDDFIVEDTAGGGRLGRPQLHPDIPLEFTSFASAKPRELFPHIIEWLVKNKIAPAFSRDDELYKLAFARVDDQVKAQAGSRLISSAWGDDFKRAVLARPDMKVQALPGNDDDNIRNCDACNRSGHPARYEFVLSGQPYYRDSLEPVEGEDEDEDDDENGNSDSQSRDEFGHVLPPANRKFYLGRFCAANAEMGHKLTHWKYHLNEALMSYLEEQGVLSPEAIVARDKMNKKKLEKLAENIVDNMQETGVIAEFWADFENDLNDARLGMEDFDRKGGRSKGRIGAVRARGGNGSIREWGNDGRYRFTNAVTVDSDSD